MTPGDGRYARICRALFGVQLFILDDFALQPIDAQARHELLEIAEERYPTYADAILDRLVHNAHRIELSGDSMRKTRSRLLKED